jgi:hypothetical protein
MKLTDHERLLLPYDPPLPPPAGGRLPSIPQLWDRAKIMFARVVDHIGSTSCFSKRWRLSRPEKKEVLGWLEPVEKIARSCLIVRALGFLMMTPQGLKLARETPKIEMPKAPHERPRPVSRTTIPTPGWHTIAQHQRALAEQRKQEEQRQAERAARDRYDPANWGCGFRVVHWQFPEPGEGASAVPLQFRKRSRVGIDVFEPNPWPAIGPPLSRPEPEREKDRPALVLARRIEALSRVLANPAPAVMRLARYIAKLPRAAVEPLKETTSSRRFHWRHGGEDSVAAAGQVRLAASVFCLDSS